MTFPLVLISVLALLHQSTAAPFADRSSSSQLNPASSNTGWTCTYDGQGNPAMDPNLDLPQLVSSLCFQVSYAHVGCAGFMPNVKSPMTGLEERPTQIMQTPCPSPLQWNTTLSICTLEVPYIPILVDVSPPGQPLLTAEDAPSLVNFTASQNIPNYEDGRVYALSTGDPVVVEDDSEGEPDAPSVVVEQAQSQTHAEVKAPEMTRIPIRPITKASPPSQPSNNKSPPPKPSSSSKKPSASKAPVHPKKDTKTNTKPHTNQCRRSTSDQTFSLNPVKRSSKAQFSDSSSCKISNSPSKHQASPPLHKTPSQPTNHRGQTPSPSTTHHDHTPVPPTTHHDSTSSQPITHHDQTPTPTAPHEDESARQPTTHPNDSDSDSSRVTAQSFDEPEGDEPDEENHSAGQDVPAHPHSDENESHADQSTRKLNPQEARPNQNNQPSSYQKPTESSSSNGQGDCQSPKQWDATVSLCLDVNADLPLVGSILASTPPVDDAASNNTDPAVTAQSFDEPETDTVGDVAQDTNSSMPILQGDYLNSTDANPTLVNEDPKPMDGNQRIASPCQSPLEWNSILSMCMEMSILPDTPGASTLSSDLSMNAPSGTPLNILNIGSPSPSPLSGSPDNLQHSQPTRFVQSSQPGAPIDSEAGCQSPGRWNAELRLCMGLSVLGNPNPSNPSNNLASLVQNPSSSAGVPAQTVGSVVSKAQDPSSPGNQNCDANEKYSSLIGKCVATSLLSLPGFGGHCTSGQYDSLIGMCVDMSLFGNPENTLEVSGKACEIGQSWSSLVNRCVANEGLTKASNDGSCSQGNYDSLLSMCLDMSILGAPKPVNPSPTSVPTYTSPDPEVNEPAASPSSSVSDIPSSLNEPRPMLEKNCTSHQTYNPTLGICIEELPRNVVFGSKTTQVMQMKSTSEVMPLPSNL